MRRGHQHLPGRSPFRPAEARPPTDSIHIAFPARESAELPAPTRRRRTSSSLSTAGTPAHHPVLAVTTASTHVGTEDGDIAVRGHES